MKKLKTVISTVLILLIALSAMPLSAFAASAVAAQDASGSTTQYTWNYTAETGTVYINTKKGTSALDGSKSKNMLPTFYSSLSTSKIWGDYDGSIVKHIVFGNNIKSIKNVCISYDNYPNVSSIEFEDNSTLETLGQSIFADCRAKNELELPSGLKTIDSYAFQTSSFQKIVIPETVTTVNAKAFEFCDAKEINIMGDPKMGDYAFSGSSAVKLTAPNVTKFYKDEFEGCIFLETVENGDKLTTVDEYAFSGCLVLREFNFNEGLSEIFANAFENTSIINAIMPSTLCWIGNSAFKGDKLLQQVKLSNEMTSIEASSFSGCSALTSVDIPESIEEIGASAFASCTSLTTVTGGEGVTGINASAFYKSNALKDYPFSDVLTTVGDNAFAYTALTELELHKNGDITIGASTFEGCDKLTDVVLNSNITKIGECAFKNCTALKNFSITESELNGEKVGMTELNASKMLYGDYAIENLSLPSTLTSVENGAFTDCGNVDTVLDLTNTALKTIGSGAFMKCRFTVLLPETVESVGENAFNGSYGKTVSFSDKLTTLGQSAFENSKLETIDLTNSSLLKIENNTFSNCESLTTVKLPKNCTAIDTCAFDDAVSLNEIVFNDKLETIGNYAFDGTTNLENIMLPASVSSIGNYAFYASGIKNVNLSGLKQELSLGNDAFSNTKRLSTISFSSNGVAFGTDVFYNSAVSSVDIPSCEVIGADTFEDCVNLEHIKLPENLVQIGKCAFQSSGLTEITIPANVVNIGERAFEGTDKLRKVVFDSSVKYDERPAMYEMLRNSFLNQNDDVVWYAFGGSVFAYYANLNLVTFVPLEYTGYEPGSASGEKPISEASGTWSNGTWRITKGDFSRLIITGEGELTNEFTDSETGETYSTVELLNKYTSCKRIVIYSGITSIGDNFLYDESTELKYTMDYVVIPSTVESIGENAFRNVGIINSVSFSEGLVSIGNNAFNGSRHFTKLTIPSTVEYIGDYAFYGTAVESVALSDNVKTVGKYAFANNLKLTSATLNNTVTEISEGVFNGTGIKKITVPSNVTTIDKKAFADCTSLAEIKLDNPQITVYYDELNPGDNAIGFKSDGSYTTKTLVIYGAYASPAYNYASNAGIKFSGNKAVATYAGYIPQANTILKNKPLEWYYYADKKMLCIDGEGYINGDGLYLDDGTKFTKKLDVDTAYICPGITQIHELAAICNPRYVTIPGSVITLTNKAFANCTNLYAITIPASVKNIDEKAFSNCTSLAAVYFKAGCEKVPDNLFKGNVSLQYVDLGGVREIGRRAFYGCTNLQRIVIPDTVKTIDSYAFGKCISVQSITLGANVEKINDSAFSNLPLCETVNFDSNAIMSIAVNAFTNSGASTTGINVVYSDNVKTARLTGFDGVNVGSFTIGKNVESIVLPNQIPSLKSIAVDSENPNYYTYYGCLYDTTDTLIYAPQSLTAIDIKSGTKAIGSNAFSNSNISTIVLPKGVTEIKDKAFYNASQLKIVYFPNTVETIGNSAFENCTRLKTMDISNPVKSIGSSAFRRCTNLASVILPDTLETIGADCFNGCSSLTGIVIPKSVTDLGIGALAYCAKLTDVYVWYANIGYNAFKGTTNVNVYTMAGSNAYEYARANKIPYGAYTDEDMFYDECALKLDALAGYLGTCADGHGDIQWLTVYSADCSNDGYIIGVCEYCSEILEEKHIDAYGHNYKVTADIAATANTKGMKVYTCSNCNDSYCEYTDATGSDITINKVTVSGRVVIATNKEATQGKTPAKNVSVVIDGYTVATTDKDGCFSFEIETGVYEVELKYAYGFTRSVYLIAEDENITVDDIPIIGCDFNKDGKIDNDDLKLFQYVVSSGANDPSYLEFVDMNNDGYINAKDRMYIVSCKGIDSSTYAYGNIIIQK